MIKKILNWLIYGDRSPEPEEKIEFLKGLHRSVEAVENESQTWSS